MDEDRETIVSAVKDGQAVHTTLNSRGWQEVIKPALDMRKRSLMGEFSGATAFEEFVRIQQMINAIDGLTNFIECKLIEGKNALEELKRK